MRTSIPLSIRTKRALDEVVVSFMAATLGGMEAPEYLRKAMTKAARIAAKNGEQVKRRAR